jgi:hypothetical protein
LVIAKLGSDGSVSLYNHAGTTHLIVDVAGWFPEGSGIHATVPARLLDTRGEATIDGVHQGGGALAGGATLQLKVAGRGGVPASGAGAVVLNVTATQATEPTFVTVYPSGAARPLASNLNLAAGATTPNLVIAKLGSDGSVSLYNHAGTTHLIVDVAGWFPTSDTDVASFTPHHGTVFAGSGDVISATWHTATDGTVVLSSSSDVPPVGGHVVIFPITAAPDGFLGRVTAIATGSDSTTLAVTATTFDAAFADVKIESAPSAWPALPHALPPSGDVVQSETPEPDDDKTCTFGGELIAAPSVSFGVPIGQASFSLSDRYALFKLEFPVTIKYSLGASAAFSCTWSVPVGKFLAPYGFVVSGDVEVQLSASVAVTASAGELTVPVTVGFRYANGEFDDLRGADLDGNASGSFPTPSGSISAGVAFVAGVKWLDVVGAELSVGPDIALEAVDGCGKIVGSFELTLATVLGNWGIEWSYTFVTLSANKVLGRFGDCAEWVGGGTFEAIDEFGDPGSFSRSRIEFDVGGGACQFSANLVFGCDDFGAVLTIQRDVTFTTTAYSCLTGGLMMMRERSVVDAELEFESALFESSERYDYAWVQFEHNNASYPVTTTRSYARASGCNDPVPATHVFVTQESPFSTGNPYAGLTVFGDVTVSDSGSSGSGVHQPNATSENTGEWNIIKAPE